MANANKVLGITNGKSAGKISHPLAFCVAVTPVAMLSPIPASSICTMSTARTT